MSDMHAKHEKQEEARAFDAAAYLQGVDESGGRKDSVPTGFPSVDTLLGGGPRSGDLVVLGGEVGSGKSALAMATVM